MIRLRRSVVLMVLSLGLFWACPFDMTFREYLSARFWMPFSRHATDFVKQEPHPTFQVYAGMASAQDATPISKLRAAYQGLIDLDAAGLTRALAAVRTLPNLQPEIREEAELIDAKIVMRNGSTDNPVPLLEARRKFLQFLKTARTPALLSEARGWVAYTHYMLGEQSAAGKIYLDELNRSDSNLSREILLNSLRLTYGYNGGETLREQLQDYFDTPEHAAFAIKLVTNPQWSGNYYPDPSGPPEEPEPLPYSQIKGLLEKHAALLRSERGANALALLAMRTALRAGDLPAALRLAANVPSRSAIRTEPDFLWILASARFLSKDFKAAETPLLQLFRSPKATPNQKAAAAYGLCGVYKKLDNTVEQLRFVSWLGEVEGPHGMSSGGDAGVAEQSIYWAYSGWDRSMILDAEAPIDALQQFIVKYPNSPGIQLVRYSLAVRLARENRYDEAAQMFDTISARLRARRMREMAVLYKNANDPEGKYKLALYLSENSERIYFNDSLWNGYQSYVFTGATEYRFTRAERERQIALERKLKDDQEERWRAHLILQEVVKEAGPSPLGIRAARLSIACLDRISERFRRPDEIRAAQIELIKFLRSARK